MPHTVTLVCQNIHMIGIFPCKYHTMHFFFFAELALGIIFLAISSIFTCCESGWLNTITHQKKALLISHIHTQHTTTPPKTSHPAAWWQPGSRGQFCIGEQLGGSGSSAAAWQRQLQLGCGRKLGGVSGSTAALWQQWQLGGGGQLGGGSGSLAAARRRRRQ
jgi:hypothetical protein